MLFHSAGFFVFFALVLLVFYSVPLRTGKLVLLFASYFFYAAWNWKFVPLLFTLTVIDYFAARLLETLPEHRRHLALIAGVSANLAFLGFFKYYNFAAAQLGFRVLDIVLPLGISFHTFQSISYIVDVYRRQQKPIRSFSDYALFISFFPQLVAGPIVRAREFFQDLYRWHAPSIVEIQRGLMLFLIGMTKKMVFADQFGQASDSYYNNLVAYPGPLPAWTATFAFAMQIFFDFSGYTDMAIGVAQLLGFHFPDNFARPYLAGSITGFWRRWHMSLSRWLRDYLYIPLGGSRRGKWRTHRNLMITMLLGGLWHGASWNFVLWGGWHGLLLALERATQRKLGLPLTFAAVLLGWVPFRASGFTATAFVLRQMFSRGAGQSFLSSGLLILTFVAIVGAVAEERWALSERFATAPFWVQVATIFAFFVCLEFFSITEQQRAFIYFQF